MDEENFYVNGWINSAVDADQEHVYLISYIQTMIPLLTTLNGFRV